MNNLLFGTTLSNAVGIVCIGVALIVHVLWGKH